MLVSARRREILQRLQSDGDVEARELADYAADAYGAEIERAAPEAWHHRCPERGPYVRVNHVFDPNFQ